MGGAFQPPNLALYGYGHQIRQRSPIPKAQMSSPRPSDMPRSRPAFFVAAAIKAQQILNSITGRSKTPPPPPAVDPGIGHDGGPPLPPNDPDRARRTVELGLAIGAHGVQWLKPDLTF